MIIVRAKKDLFHHCDRSKPSFKKGKTYHSESYSLTYETVLINEFGEHHQVGNWLKNFKVILS
jgi:hypothetical protein